MKRNSRENIEWKSRVNVRDDFKCQRCGKTGREAHHKKSWKEFPELRFDVDNGETLCMDCHNKAENSGRPKTKEGKVVTFYLSFDAIEKLREYSQKNKKSMSQHVDDLIQGKNGKA